ncbi:uncharacterized protein ARMOST_01319 [Armillaria ostoyae]|uniref:Uncharacterized protein n=1 Tax=Armillaria ostoyae TaxID=47428 RepID=A0A284QNK1_ARMOS|nr:uncharacterized protein ARMOST_01319 [Armillaria ostoyae]
MDYTKNSLSLGVHQGVSRAFNSSISEYVLGTQKQGTADLRPSAWRNVSFRFRKKPDTTLSSPSVATGQLYDSCKSGFFQVWSNLYSRICY